MTADNDNLEPSEQAGLGRRLRKQFVIDSLEAHTLTVRPIHRSGLFEDQVDGTPIAERLDIRFPRRVSTYYSVTKAEIDSYAQFDWLSSLLLTFFGTAAGFALGCVAALAQGNIPAGSQTTLTWLAWTIGGVSLVFLAFAIILKALQSRNKKKWESQD